MEYDRSEKLICPICNTEHRIVEEYDNREWIYYFIGCGDVCVFSDAKFQNYKIATEAMKKLISAFVDIKIYMLMTKTTECFGHGDYRPVYTPKTNKYDINPAPVYMSKEKARESFKKKPIYYEIVKIDVL